MSPLLPRTLILDFYDSYTNNLLTLFTKLYSDAEVLEKVVVVKADRFTWDEFRRSVLPDIDCIILSPGPGRPDNPADIGFALDLIRLHPIPILGVCLGHQAIGVAFGGKIANTPRITHGHVVSVTPVSPVKGLFASPIWAASSGLHDEEDTFEAVVYNSLIVDPDTIPDELEVTAWSTTPRGRDVVQGLSHKAHPIWGVQYHPESISSARGSALLRCFLEAVHIHHDRPQSYPLLADQIKAACAYRIAAGPSKRRTAESIWPTPPISPASSISSLEQVERASLSLRLAEKRFGGLGRKLATPDIFQTVVRSRKGKERAVGEVWLDGQTPTRLTTTSLAAPSFLLTYSLTTRTITLHTEGGPLAQLRLGKEEAFWDWFASGQASLSDRMQDQCMGRSGWKGGWVGWFGYEMKEESLLGYRHKSGLADEEKVDACWAWADRLLERTEYGEWVARGVIRDDEVHAGLAGTGDNDKAESLVDWLERLGVSPGVTASDFDTYAADIEQILSFPPTRSSRISPSFPSFHPTSSGTWYRQQVDSCREAIRQGESYELTLTTSFTFPLTPEADPFELYLRLRTFNPAYYSTYMSFPCLELYVLSSSPERFLKISGEREVEMMPIKGTRARIKPGQCVCSAGRGCGGGAPGSEACLDEAEREDRRRGEDLQNDSKERAENLMIVDLIRSDLLSCCIPSTVTVPKLIALESYGVHNLVTTVRGSLAVNMGSVEAVKRCFPPGSMTGAPKLRSVQLLDDLEGGRRRGIYSGALGYFSIDGPADLSVVIRTIVIEGDRMTLGAGGAITWLSDRDKEWDEVLTKVRSVVGSLEGV